MKLTTSFRLNGPKHADLMSCCEHIAFPLGACSHECAAAMAFFRNADATHCIVSTKGRRDAIVIARCSKSEDEWTTIRERK